MLGNDQLSVTHFSQTKEPLRLFILSVIEADLDSTALYDNESSYPFIFFSPWRFANIGLCQV